MEVNNNEHSDRLKHSTSSQGDNQTYDILENKKHEKTENESPVSFPFSHLNWNLMWRSEESFLVCVSQVVREDWPSVVREEDNTREEKTKRKGEDRCVR